MPEWNYVDSEKRFLPLLESYVDGYLIGGIWDMHGEDEHFKDAYFWRRITIYVNEYMHHDRHVIKWILDEKHETLNAIKERIIAEDVFITVNTIDRDSYLKDQEPIIMAEQAALLAYRTHCEPYDKKPCPRCNGSGKDYVFDRICRCPGCGGDRVVPLLEKDIHL